MLAKAIEKLSLKLTLSFVQLISDCMFWTKATYVPFTIISTIAESPFNLN